jgi:hypothetical protein
MELLGRWPQAMQANVLARSQMVEAATASFYLFLTTTIGHKRKALTDSSGLCFVADNA